MKSVAQILFCSLAVASTVASANPSDAFWSGNFGRLGTGGRTHTVEAIEIHGGDLYVTGSFNSATDQLAGSIARWDGSSWQGLTESCNGTVNTLFFEGNDIYAGGGFSEIDGVDANGIARWDGISWSALGSGVSGSVTAILRHDGDLYVGGLFSTAGGVASPSIARWDGSSWAAVGGGIEPFFLFDGVHALATDGADLIVAGQFQAIGGLSVGNVARWDGSAWSTMGDGLTLAGQPGSVSDLALYGGQIHAGGSFTDSGPSSLNQIARWDGSAWVDVGGGVIFSSSPTSAWIRDLKVHDGKLYAAGRFSHASGGATPAGLVAWWDGATWAGYTGPNIDFLNVRQVGIQGGDIHIAGSFRDVNDVVASHVARWDGVNWNALSNVVADGIDGDVLAVASDATGKVYVGGGFDTAGDLEIRSLARWDGTVWQGVGGGMNVVAGRRADVLAIEVTDNDVYVAGDFSDAGGVSAENIARWDGANWNALGGGLTHSFQNTVVFAMEEQGGAIYAGGRFTDAGGAPAANIAMWDGSTWSALGSGTDDIVFTVVSLGGDIYAGGDFSSAGGVPADHVARWDGAVWSTVGDGFDGKVRILAVHDGALHAGGSFVMSGASTVNGIARWNGIAWEALDDGLQGGFVEVRALASIENLLYVGGQFDTAGSPAIAANNVARWDGVAWSDLGDGTNASVSSLARVNDALYVGGFHTLAGGKPSSHISRWLGVVTSADTTPARGLVLLDQNVPNPFNPRTQIHYVLDADGPVTLKIYDAAGRLVRTLVDAVQSARPEGHTVTWDGTGGDRRMVASGVYFYTLTAPERGITRKMLLLK